MKGIGILQVVLFHCLGRGAAKFATPGGPAWIAMRSLAWAINFAIPLFLLLSAMLLAGSLAKSQNVGRFVWRRASRTVWPYVLWSVFYWVLRWRSNPRTFERPAHLAVELLTGKAEYHLYFMVILFQLSVAIPFVVALLRRMKVGFGGILLVSGILQFLAFEANRIHQLNLRSPGSSITWYIPSLLIGAWIGLNRDAWTEVWRRMWPFMLLIGVLAGAEFTTMSVLQDLNFPSQSLAYNGASVVFRVAISLVLLGAAGPLASTSMGPTLAALGRYSLPIYLVHPAILELVSRNRVLAILARFPMPVLWMFLAVTILSYVFAWACGLARLDGPLFGQSLPRRAASTAA